MMKSLLLFQMIVFSIITIEISFGFTHLYQKIIYNKQIQRKRFR